ncbi:Fur-regulated basic protein FbpB [Bacillus atrophaeus]|nr:Fur-regulated basic protein FbpB [Bacillus atrophaeus]MCY8918595.1 Fur-regulated basic protein FbpB [Bacillus atrophaeus]MCY8926718.1 Fur-regulated basic protein FbpB [Bacillus atrophaeus]MCY8973188.1 Fur-regulated basic protein FbpB [Bacillus atrophaeus]MED4804243.1 Fur-regulated basic protein FbpB [Bacillus atrophaeus]MED4817856.1 Fur-regulated basic protein FbpB [Bacillus atrophaeus]
MPEGCRIMPKRKVKTYEQLVQENKEAIIRSSELMNVIYDRIDRKYQKQLQEKSNT